SLDKTPELWAKLEQDDITLREACGNTVRNITASHTAGIDPNEPFDVSPYAGAMRRSPSMPVPAMSLAPIHNHSRPLGRSCSGSAG
ncbi:MAG: hypothetical protein ABI619_08050, partial [Betaproteobacteria bacterium]